jgi:UDP-N-acetylglucosamine--N-acetylmuramyl-(pentapeptide) pyrophosphoryl-undecaprenol N-acetylglucosamine transferase
MSGDADTPRSFAVVTGGGTAGHVLPALAIVAAIESEGIARESVHYVGAQRGIEARMLPSTGIPHTLLDVVGLQRRVDRAAVRTNLSFPLRLVRAVRRAGRLLDELSPRVVVSVGGYASLPAVLAARRRRIPVVVVVYDRTPGRSSRLTARFAAATAVAFEDLALPRQRLTGAPVRSEILALDRATGRDAARSRLGLPIDRFVVGVIGGSQGSGLLNDAVASLVEARRDDDGLAVRHVVGERFLEQVVAGSSAAAMSGMTGEGTPPRGILYQVIGYEEHMDDVYAAVDVLIGRGGASTVAEVAVTGTPSILVPWSGAADDHQRANVDWLASAGACVLLAESDIGRLGDVIDELRHDDQRRTALAVAAHERGSLHRSGALASLVMEVARS